MNNPFRIVCMTIAVYFWTFNVRLSNQTLESFFFPLSVNVESVYVNFKMWEFPITTKQAYSNQIIFVDNVFY